jgi:hypothetical protein
MPTDKTVLGEFDLNEADLALILDALELWAALGQQGAGRAAAAQAEAATDIAARLRGAMRHPPTPDRMAVEARQILARCLAERGN